MKILLAVDESKYSQAALQSVLQKAHPEETKVRVLHVLEPILKTQPRSSHRVYAEMMVQRRQDATEMVKRAAESLEAVGFKTCSFALGSGIPKVVILDEAKKWGADLIVLGSHGRMGLDLILLGSLSKAVARRAACSVEIVRAPA
jgi:nucleotide-binding universal stress UspA family protein